MIHPLSDAQSPFIGENTNVWPFCEILPKAIIENNFSTCSHVRIEHDVQAVTHYPISTTPKQQDIDYIIELLNKF